MKKNSINTQDVLSMRGEGYYSERTAGARNVINEAGEMIYAALGDLPDSTALKIADYGAADGGTSQQMWDKVIRRLRDAGDMRQIEIIYTDLASNDFSTLFRKELNPFGTFSNVKGRFSGSISVPVQNPSH